jgi:uncharacterized membrane protein (Fun14 family)
MAQENSLHIFDKPAAWYIEIAGYLIAGFILGFLIKYAGRLFFLLLLGALISLWALDYFQIVTIHYTVLKQVLGVSRDMTMTDFLTQTNSWIRTHIIESLAVFFGFVLSWKFA